MAIVPHGPKFSHNAAFSAGEAMWASSREHGAAMAKAVQSWVKPEVDPPTNNALPRGIVIREGHRPAWPKI
ncbi:MAG: hypothetical protein ACKOEZ_04275, partial [Spartobacteria bacterium]